MTKTENLTPQHLKCPWGQCPSVHRLEDGRLRIVGRIAEPHEMNGANRGDDEEAIIISADLLATLREEWVREAVEAERKAIMAQLGYHADGSIIITTTVRDKRGEYLLDHDAYYELEGALIDLKRDGADAICIDTIERVQAQIAAVVRYAKAATSPAASPSEEPKPETSK